MNDEEKNRKRKLFFDTLNEVIREHREEFISKKKTRTIFESNEPPTTESPSTTEPESQNFPSSTYKPIFGILTPKFKIGYEGRQKNLYIGKEVEYPKNTFNYFFNHMDTNYTGNTEMKNPGLEDSLYLNLPTLDVDDETARGLSERICYYKNVSRAQFLIPGTFSVAGFDMLFNSLGSCPNFSDLMISSREWRTTHTLCNEKEQKMASLSRFVRNSKTLKNFVIDTNPCKNFTCYKSLIESLGSSESLRSLDLLNTCLIKDLFCFIYNESLKNSSFFRHLKRLHLDSPFECEIFDIGGEQDMVMKESAKSMETDLNDLIMFLKIRPNIKKLSIVCVRTNAIMGRLFDKLSELDNIEFLSVDTSWWNHYYNNSDDLELDRKAFKRDGDEAFDKLLNYISKSKNLKGLTIIGETQDMPYYVDKLLESLYLSPSLEILVLSSHSDLNPAILDQLFLSNPKIKVISLDPMKLKHRAFNLYNTLCMSNTGNFTKNWRGLVLENNPIFAESYDPINNLPFRSPYYEESLKYLNMNSLYSRSITTIRKNYNDIICFEEGCRINNETRTKRTFAETELESSMVDDGISIHLSILKPSILTFLICLKLKTNEWSESTRINLRPPPYIKHQILIYYLIANNRYFKNLIISTNKSSAATIKQLIKNLESTGKGDKPFDMEKFIKKLY